MTIGPCIFTWCACVCSLSLSLAVTVRLSSTAYTWSEGDGEVAIMVEKIGSNERVISATLQADPMTALGNG